MNLNLKPYKEQINEWPKSGYHIMAQYDAEKIIVYQSYRNAIGNYAVKNQHFGGEFSLTRMTWIKPNFLWMMYRNGWGIKEGQESVLAIHLKMSAFENYLNNAIYSSFDQVENITQEKWQAQVKSSNVRLQWDPDHDPHGAKLERRAIQIGLRNQFIESYAKDDILLIEDISTFAKEQHQYVLSNNLDELITPYERPLLFNDDKLNTYLKLK